MLKRRGISGAEFKIASARVSRMNRHVEEIVDISVLLTISHKTSGPPGGCALKLESEVDPGTQSVPAGPRRTATLMRLSGSLGPGLLRLSKLEHFF